MHFQVDRISQITENIRDLLPFSVNERNPTEGIIHYSGFNVSGISAQRFLSQLAETVKEVKIREAIIERVNRQVYFIESEYITSSSEKDHFPQYMVTPFDKNSFSVSDCGFGLDKGENIKKFHDFLKTKTLN
jgi:hypothetical protein